MKKATFCNLLVVISLFLSLPLLGMLQVSLLEKKSLQNPLINKLFSEKQEILMLGYTQDKSLEEENGTISVIETYIFPEYKKGSFSCNIITQHNTAKNNLFKNFTESTLSKQNGSCDITESPKQLILVDNTTFHTVLQLLLNKGYEQKVSSPKLTRPTIQSQKETFKTGTTFYDAWTRFINN